ncbi:PREDICTED: transport and Golgi organization protein 1 [Rhagoletis zephyria]|uniref:transport and Golgi organization protein 1 n=1 Tax=Rhagoletis zephyria TaxID=28612 RepID=UPI0008117656|nr:PREDICTED: transport and Golgi organization protein 1 [Rhagoletis zephyria]XP_036327686.1 transport and Golgi organization protein 1 [Rhagoletis pomonella]
MFGWQNSPTMKSALVLLGICYVFLPETCSAEGLSDLRLCADPECHDIISLGSGKINYSAGEKGIVSFKMHSKIRVKSKSAGKNKKLWGIEVNGREGYAPKEFILEEKVLVKESDLKYIVPVTIPGSKKTMSTVSPSPTVDLKPSEKLYLPKDEVEISTTAPLNQPLNEEKLISVNESDSSISKVEISYSTPVQPSVELVDGTTIPVLEDVIANATNLPSTSDEDTLTQELLLLNETTNRKNENAVADTEQITSKQLVEPVNQKNFPKKHEAEGLKIKPLDKPSDADGNDENKDDEEDDDDEKEGDDEKDDNQMTSDDFNQLENKIESPIIEEDKMISSSEANEVNIISSNNRETPLGHKLDENSSDNNNKENSLPEDIVQASTEIPLSPPNNETDEKGLQTNERESSSASNIKETEDLPRDVKTNPENNVEQLPKHKINEISNEIIEVNAGATTEASGTDTNYLNHGYPSEESFDSTTLPTVLLPHAQSPETQVSGAPETLAINNLKVDLADINEEVLETVPHEFSKVPKTTPENISEKKVSMNSIRSNNTTQSSITQSSEVASEEKDDGKISGSEQIIPTLPLFQTPMQNGHLNQHQQQYHHDPYQHMQKHQHSNTQPQDHTQQNGITEASQLTITEKTEVKTEASPIQHSDSNDLPHALIPNEAVEKYQSQTVDYSDALVSEETQSDKYEDPMFATNDGDIQNDNDVGVGSVQKITSHSTSAPPVVESIPATPRPDVEIKEREQGLFATIVGTVNTFLSNDKKGDMSVEDDELQRILFPERLASSKKAKESDGEYCEKLTPNDCPSHVIRELHNVAESSSISGCQLDWRNMSMDMLLTVAGNKMLEMKELLVCLATVAVTCLFFLFVYYCFCNSSREGELLAKLNALERSLLATHKENAILKEDLMGTRNKLSSIEDNSFGSNDMVIALKKELEEELLQKRQLLEQVGNLEKELENAAEAGLELNKIVSELLSNQTGDESIISSVEELQKQLNEQQKTILDINANLAEKSRENSELQLMIAEQNARLSGEIASLQQDNDELEVEKSNLQTRLEEVKREFEEDITKALESKNFEIKRLQSELVELSNKLETEYTRYQTSLAKVEALQECLRTVRRDPNVNITKVIDVANVRAELIDMQKRYDTLKERLDTEMDGKKLAEEQLLLASSENEKIKHEFHQSEKDKLEAQTRLEVLSTYFKEKETQLQKELSLKEAMWLKQQGETTSTVDRLTTMQEEIQALKSQNDALRAEIEAQLAAHKAQTGTLENRAHETWLAARQSERRYEEARAEATALRRKLTALAGVGGGATGEANFEKLAGPELNNAPSPIHMESPGSPLLGRLPPPPFLPPPFMGPPPPFMAMPPPFVPPGEMRPPPLGRLMSPPPGAGSGGSGGSGRLLSRRGGRYSPNRSGYEDYDDDEDEDDYADDDEEEDDLEDEDEEERLRQRRRRRGSDVNGSWHRDDSYSPPPRAYRSQSPTDSRYNYTTERGLMSTYDTETDFEPSPRKPERRGVRVPRTDSYRDYSPPPSASSPLNVSSNSNTGKKHPSSAFSKGHMSSGSEKSFNAPPQRHGGKKSGKSVV